MLEPQRWDRPRPELAALAGASPRACRRGHGRRPDAGAQRAGSPARRRDRRPGWGARTGACGKECAAARGHCPARQRVVDRHVPASLTHEREPHQRPPAGAAAPGVATQVTPALPTTAGSSAQAGAARAQDAPPAVEANRRGEVRRQQARRNATTPRTQDALSSAALASELDLLRRAPALVDTRPAEAAWRCSRRMHGAIPRACSRRSARASRFDALRKLGRREQAHARARAFVQRYPQSPHTRRISAWLEPIDSDHKNEASPLPTR